MTYRSEADALREKLAAAEADNKRLREEMKRSRVATEQLHKDEHKKAKAEAAAARRARWSARWNDNVHALTVEVQRILTATFILMAAVAAVAVVVFIFDSINRYNLDARNQRHDAEVARLNDLRADVPDGIDPHVWSWCVDHCVRFGQPGTAGTYEGVVTDVFVDYNDGTATTTRATIRGPWLSSTGATAISTSFGVTSLVRGNIVVVRRTENGIYVTQRTSP